MPYKLSSNGLCVEKEDGTNVKCHKTHKEALGHLAALEINVVKKEKRSMPDSTKAEDAGKGGFLVEEDGKKHLPTTKNGKPDHRLMGAAFAALTGGYRGRKYGGPNKESALSKLKKLYEKEGLPLPSEGKAVEPPKETECEACGCECKDCTCEDGKCPDCECDMSDYGEKEPNEPTQKAMGEATMETGGALVTGDNDADDKGGPSDGDEDNFHSHPHSHFVGMGEEFAHEHQHEHDKLHGVDESGMGNHNHMHAHDHGHTHPDGTVHGHEHFHGAPHDGEGDVHNHDHESFKSLDFIMPKKLEPIKMIGETRFAAYGLKFAPNPKEKDLTGTFFKKETNYGKFYDHAPIYYHHGLNEKIDLEQIGDTVKAQLDDIGIWVEGELNKSNQYWKAISDLIKQGKLYYSSGTAEHLIRYGNDGEIKNWPVMEWTLTPTPAEPRLNSVAFYKSIGIKMDDEADALVDGQGKGDEKSRGDQKHEEQKREVRNISPDEQNLEVEMEKTEIADLVKESVKAALEANKAEALKVVEDEKKKKEAEDTRQAEIKAAVDAEVAKIKAALPADPTQRPGYGQFNMNTKHGVGEFSWVKAVRGIILQSKGAQSAWSGAEKERDIMTKYANEIRATLAEGVGNLGGYLVPPEYLQDQFIPLLRARAVVRGAGPRILQTSSDIVYIPQQTGGATANWLGENATLSASNMTFGQLAINVRKLAALEYISNELLADASPSADQLIREDLAAVIALKEDSTFFLSNGAAPSWANAPLGFPSMPGVTQYTLAGDVGNGIAITAAHIFAFKLNMMQNNVPADSWAWFMSPRSWGEVAELKDTQNRYLLDTLTGGNISQYPAYGNYPQGPETSYLGSVQGRLLGWPVYVTANITETNTKGNNTDCSFMYLVRMPDVIIAERAGLELMATNVAGTSFASDQTWIRGIMREGWGVRHAPGVTYADGVR